MPSINIDSVVASMPKKIYKKFIRSQTSTSGRCGNLLKFSSQKNWQEASLRSAIAYFEEIGIQPKIDDPEKIGYGLIILAGQNPHYNKEWKRLVWDNNPQDIIKALEAGVLAAGDLALSIRNLPSSLRSKLAKYSTPSQQETPDKLSARKEKTTQREEPEQHIYTIISEDALIRYGRELESQGFFDPDNENDARKRIEASIVQRSGQTRFRKQLLRAYSNQCAITGCDVSFSLEAAHILPYKGQYTNDVRNGLLLRADIHTLFDLGKISINPETFRVFLAEDIRETSYNNLHGKIIKLPENDELKPDKEALTIHFNQVSTS